MRLSTISLPLLDYTATLFERVSLENTLVIGVQHLLPTTYLLFQALFKQGLDRSNLAILGKCYSTDPSVFTQLKNEGVYVSELSYFFDSHRSYDEQYDEIIIRFISAILAKYSFTDYEKVIVLDDGGHLLEGLLNLDIKHSNIVAVEQTSSGYNRLKEHPVRFPVVNIARCSAKLIYETPLIINRVISCLEHWLQHAGRDREHILILGQGTLGSAIYKKLRDNFKLTKYDKDPSKSMVASHDFLKILDAATVVLGCTGTTALPGVIHEHIRAGTVLLSLSSSDREFDAVHFRKRLPVDSNCHRDILSQGIHLLNSGFPINFNSEYDSVDTDDFQFTRSLLLAGLIQAYKCSHEYGFIELDKQIEKKIVAEAFNLDLAMMYNPIT